MSQYMKAGYTPPKPPKKSNQKPAAKKPQGNMPRRQTPTPAPRVQRPPKVKRPLGVRILRWIAAILAVCVIAVLAFLVFAYQELSPYREWYYQGVYVENIHLGGLTSEQAVTAIQSRMDEKLAAYTLEIQNESGQSVRTLLPSDVSLGHDLQGQLNEAWNVGRGGNLIEQMQALEKLREEPQVFSWKITYDAQLLADYVSALAAQIDCEAIDAQASFVPDSVHPFVFTEDQIGAKLDQEDLKKQLDAQLQCLGSAAVVMKVETQEPALTRAQLEENISLRARVHSEVSSRSSDNRNENIRLAIESVNGVMLKPGETFDFNAVVGKRTAQRGYKEAEEIAYGEDVSGIGGGVCQAATAVYQAALTAGLEITEHHPHVFPADYAPAGQDATVSDQGLNLMFRNQTAYPVYIKARFFETDDDAMRMEVVMFGAPLEAAYTLESVLEEIAIPEAIRVRDKDQTYVTYTDEEKQISDGRIGYLAQTYRVAWKDGAEISRTLAAESTYQPVAPRIYVGTTVRETEGK